MSLLSKFETVGEKLFPFVKNAVVSVEQLIGAGNGTAKKQAVLNLVSTGISVLDIATGLPIPADLVAIAVGPLIDAVVNLLNVTGVLPHSAPAATTPAS